MTEVQFIKLTLHVNLMYVCPYIVVYAYSSFHHPGRIAYCPAPDRRPPATKALSTICGNNTSIVSDSC